MMHPNGEETYKIIALTLGHIGEVVIRVSNNEEVTHGWGDIERLQITTGTKLGSVAETALLGKNAGYIRKAIAERCDVRTATDVQIFSICADKDGVYIVVLPHVMAEPMLQEERWKMALDASGDGVWDMNMETGEVLFSEKWHRNFDQHFTSINTSRGLQALVHPEDFAASKERLALYQKGEVSDYSCELRYRCIDGSYKWLQSTGVIISRKADGTPVRAIGSHVDIDQRKQAEKLHSSTQQLLSTLIDNLQDGLVVVDDAQILFANQAFCDIYDIAEPPQKFKGTPTKDSLAARSLKVKDPVKFAARAEEVRAARKPVKNDQIELLNGKTYSRDYIPISLSDGRNAEIWKLRDITEEKNANKRFEEQRVFYERILNNMPADLAVHDADHRFLYINHSAVKDEELRKWLIGKRHADYTAYRNLSPQLSIEREARFNRVIEKKDTVEFTERLVNKDGEVSYHLRRLSPVFDSDGQLDLVIVYGANITGLVLAEQALKKSRDTFANAFNFSGTGMALLSPEGRWIEVNNALCQITGYTREELLSKTYREITFPGDLAGDDIAIGKLLSKELQYVTLEKRYVSKSNKIIWVLLNVSMVWNEDGTPGFFIAQIADITQRKELEAELTRKNSELEAARLSLVNKVSQMNELNHMIAHNLRGPAGNIKMLSDPDEHSFDALEKDEVMNLIHQSSMALMDSLNTLMETAEIKLNKDITYDDCDFNEIIHNIINQLHASIYEKHAQIEVRLEQTSVKYPKAYLESILYNLLSNALKYTVPNRPTGIVVSTKVADGHTVLSVKDNGVGIDLKRFEHKLFHLNQIFHHGYDSKGIGLFITKTQIESLGGTITVKSEPDKGAEFIVTF
jgi:PAS domain S-box-containing protein